MITVIILKNPFNASERELYRLDYIPGKTATQYLQPYRMGLDVELVVSHNGKIVDDADIVIPMPGDYIAACAVVGKSDGKNPLAMLASIALMTVSMGTGSMVMGGEFMGSGFIGMAGWTSSWAYVAAGAVMYLGGQLIANAFAPPAPDLDGFSQTPTYGWGKQQVLEGQGRAVGITYGTVKPNVQVLAKHITSDGDKQYLNLLLCGGEGPVDSIEDIRINDNPIANYKDVQVDIRLGTNDQETIPNFGDTFADQYMQYELTADGQWATHQTEGDGGEGLEIVVELPAGLYHVNDDGNLENATVKVAAEYRKVGEQEWRPWPTREVVGTPGVTRLSLGANGNAQETWTLTCIDVVQSTVEYLPGMTDATFSVVGSIHGTQPNAKLNEAYSNGFINFTITGLLVPYFMYNIGDTITLNPSSYWTIHESSNTAFRRAYRLDNLPVGRYEVRCRCVEKPPDDTRHGSKVYWTTLSHIVYDDFARPGKVLVGIKALATDQLSGSVPTVSWIQKRSKVHVWNPVTDQYEEKSANNAAWAAYDTLHRCKLLKNINTGQFEYTVFGDEASRFMYQEFADWAEWCEQKGLHVNLFIDNVSDIWNALKSIEGIGRGKVMLRGTRYGAVCDRPSQPVQMFTVGNTLQGTFLEEYLPLKDRANAVEVSFLNKNKDYQKDTLTVFGEGWNEDKRQSNPVQISLYGITDPEQAYREGYYRLLLNKYLLRTCSFEADVDAIACQAGDIILVQADVPQWGFGGRILAATTTTLTLDQTVVMEAGKEYGIIVRLADDSLILRSVQSVTEMVETNTITVVQPFSAVPQKWDVYSFGEINKVTKPFKVVTITRSQDLRRRITCLEYNEAVYAADGEPPVFDYQAKQPNIRGLVVASRIENGQHLLNVSWTPLQNYHGADVLINGVKSIKVEWDKNTVSIPAKPGSYSVTVKGLDQFGYEVTTLSQDYTIGAANIQGVQDIVAMEHVRETGAGAVVNELEVLWTPSDIGYDYAEVWAKSDNPSWDEINKPWDNLDASFETIGDNANAWKFVGKANTGTVIPNVVKELRYTIKIVTVLKGGIQQDFDVAPVTTYTVMGKEYWPSMPTGLTVSFTDTGVWTWQPNTDLDVDFYELRTNESVGISEGMLYRGKSHVAIAKPPTRNGAVFLFAHNTSGHYSTPCRLDYYKQKLASPQNINTADVLQGITIATGPLPISAQGINVHVNDEVYFSPNNYFVYKTTGGICDIQVAYVDLFGECELSPVVTKIVKPTIDPALIEAESISLEKMDSIIQDAVSRAQASIDITTFNNAIADMVSYTAFNNEHNLMVQADQNNAAMINQTKSDVTTIVANLNKPPSQVGYTAISEIKQTADSITTTVNANKANQDGINQNLQSQITQNAGQITSVVTELGKPINECSYTAIAQAKDAIDLRVKSSDFNGQSIVSQINVSPAGTLIDGKLLHVTGQTVFDDNVIVQKMLAAGAVTADKISASALRLVSDLSTAEAQGLHINPNGMKLVEASGAYTLFDQNGITWYAADNRAYGSVKRTVQGTVQNGQYVRLNWDEIPFVIVSPKTVQTMVTGYTNSNVQIVCEPYDVSPAGFRVRIETRILDATGGQIVDLSLPNQGSEQIITTPSATKDVTVTVQADVGSYVATNPNHVYSNDPDDYLRDAAGFIGYEWSGGRTTPVTHAIGMNIEHSHQIQKWVWDNPQWPQQGKWVGGGLWTHYHRNPLVGNVVFDVYYRKQGDTTWTFSATKTLSGNGVLSASVNVLSGATPSVYEIKVVRGAGTYANSAMFKSFAVNGGGVIATTGQVNFLAMETDGNSYYTIEN